MENCRQIAKALILPDLNLEERGIEALERELRLTRVLAEITRKLLAEEYNIHQIAEYILSNALKLTGCRHGYVSAIGRRTRENVIHAFTSRQGKPLCTVNGVYCSFSPDENGHYSGLHGHALNTGDAFFTNGPERHEAFGGGLSGDHVPIHNFLSVPVSAPGRLIGQIALANTASGFSSDDLRKIKSLADIYAVALEKQQHRQEKKRLEHQLLQTHKLQVIGSLAGGIAQDFNNLLSPVLGFAEMLQEDLPADQSLQDYVREIIDGVKRAADLSRQMLVFSHQSRDTIRPVRLQACLKETLRVLRSIFPSSIEIRSQIDDTSGEVEVDPLQIQQVMMNLVSHACQAVDDTTGLILNIELRNIDIQKQDMDDLHDFRRLLETGRYVRLSVGNSGSGKNEGVLEKVFEPYFTTQQKNAGAGLGMSVTYGIIKHYHGEILIRSQPGGDTAVEVYLPRYQAGNSDDS